MDNSSVIITIQSSILLMLLVYVLGAIKECRREAFRLSLFEIRDSLFDCAANGHIDFDHPAYGMLRSTINGFIRYAHRISCTQMLIFLLFYRFRSSSLDNSFAERWETEISNLDPETQNHLRRLLSQVNFSVAWHLIGFLVHIVLPVFGPLYLANRLVRYLRALLRSIRDDFDSTAFAYGT